MIYFVFYRGSDEDVSDKSEAGKSDNEGDIEKEDKADSSEADDRPQTGKKRVLSSDDDDDVDHIDDDEKPEDDEQPSTSQGTPKKKIKKLISS